MGSIRERTGTVYHIFIGNASTILCLSRNIEGKYPMDSFLLISLICLYAAKISLYSVNIYDRMLLMVYVFPHCVMGNGNVMHIERGTDF